VVRKGLSAEDDKEFEGKQRAGAGAVSSSGAGAEADGSYVSGLLIVVAAV
jgi:hypothetical protein